MVTVCCCCKENLLALDSATSETESVGASMFTGVVSFVKRLFGRGAINNSDQEDQDDATPASVPTAVGDCNGNLPPACRADRHGPVMVPPPSATCRTHDSRCCCRQHHSAVLVCRRCDVSLSSSDLRRRRWTTSRPLTHRHSHAVVEEVGVESVCCCQNCTVIYRATHPGLGHHRRVSRLSPISVICTEAVSYWGMSIIRRFYSLKV